MLRIISLDPIETSSRSASSVGFDGRMLTVSDLCVAISTPPALANLLVSGDLSHR